MKKIVNTAFIYLLTAVLFELLMAGIIEMTKTAQSIGGIAVRPLGLIIHTHLLLLGFLFFVIIALLEKVFAITKEKPFKLFFETYNIGLIVTVGVLAYRSFGELFGFTVNKMLTMGIGTVAHILITIGLLAFFVCFKRVALKNQ